VGTVRLEIEYDGSGFNGWAAQPGLRTVQEELESALETVLRAPVGLTVAGRTDAGVHALGQVASFAIDGTPPPDLARRVNGVGPADDDFDARRDATSRTYRYRVLARPTPAPFERGRSLWWPHPLDRVPLEACAAALEGTHDFTAFTPTQTDHVRFDRDILRAAWEQDEDVVAFTITADSFMRNMVRILVGTMLDVGSGRRTVDDFTRLLDGASRKEAGDTAPPQGLYLESVSYEEGGVPPGRTDTQSRPAN
jgi:tRNA pseudouridine38-40 synthase